MNKNILKKKTEEKESKRNRWNIGLGTVKWRKRRRKHNKKNKVNYNVTTVKIHVKNRIYNIQY